MATSTATAKMTLKKWYGNALSIPKLGDRNFEVFLGSCAGLVYSVLKKNLGLEVKLRFSRIDTAAADQDNKTIYVSQNFLRGDFSGIFPGLELDSEDTISTVLGIIVHEAAHFAFSPATLSGAVEYVRKHSKYPLAEPIALALSNILEDIYIENRIQEEIPSLGWTLDFSNSIFFPEKIFNESAAQINMLTEAPSDLNLVMQIVSFLILGKTNPHKRTGNPFIDSLYVEALSVKTADSIDQRNEIVCNLYDQIVKNLDFEEIKKKAEEMGKAPEKFLEELIEKLENMKGVRDLDNEKEKELAQAVSSMTISEEVFNEIKKENMNIETMESEYNSSGTITKAEIIPLVSTKGRGKKLVLDDRYRRLAEIGRQRAVVNRPYGIDKNRGSHIRKLHRIATDGKIFAEPVLMNNYKPMEVVILIDCSGSMTGTKIESAVSAAYGAAIGLLDARCKVAVYGHTADTIAGLIVYRFKNFHESVDTLRDRLSSYYDLANNRDGEAIAAMRTKFEDRRLRQLLIVISDGMPAANGYYGLEAQKHCREEVQKLRQQRIGVLSISITREARRVNDYIYGESNNVKNDDPNVIEDVIRALIEE